MLHDTYTMDIRSVRKPCSKATVDGASHLSVNEDVHDISCDNEGYIGRCFERSGRQMRRERDTRSAQWGVYRERLLLEGIESSACYPFLLDRPANGVFVHESSSRGIHDVGALLHEADPAGVDDSFGLLRERQSKH